MNPISSHHPWLFATFLLSAVLAVGSCGEPEADADPDDPVSSGGAVSAPTMEAAEAGYEILAAGGNAVDAAAAVALALGVTQPSRAGLGGTALLLLRTPEGSVRVIRGAEPERGGESGDVTAGPPDLLRILDDAVGRFGSGRIEWETMVEPARRIAEEGFLLGREEHRARIANVNRLAEDPGAAEILLREGGSVPTERSRIRTSALAETLRRIARAGADDFYEGQLAGRLVDAARQDGEGRWQGSLPELPRAVVEDATEASYRGWRIFVVPGSPAGERILQGLRVLSRAPDEILDRSGTARTLWLAEALFFANVSGGGGEEAEGGALAWLEERPPLPSGPVADSAPTGGSPGRGSAAGRIAPAPARADARWGSTAFAVLDGSGGMVLGVLSMGREYGTGRPAGDLGFFHRSLPPEDAPPSGAATLAVRGDSLPGLGAAASGEGASDAVVHVVSGWVDGRLPLEEALSLPRLRVLTDTLGRAHLFLEGVEWSRGILDEMRLWSGVPDSLRPAAAEARAPGTPEGDSPESTAMAYWGGSVRPWIVGRDFLLGEWPGPGPGERLDPRFSLLYAVAARGGDWEVAADLRGDGATRLLTREEAEAARANRRR